MIRRVEQWGPFGPLPLAAHLPIAGEMSYQFDPNLVRIETDSSPPSARASPSRDRPRGRRRAQFRFHVATSDWQESQQVLAGILTDFGSPDRLRLVRRKRRVRRRASPARSGVRESRACSRPRHARVGHALGRRLSERVVENSYLTVKDGTDPHGDSEIRAEGLFSLGYPRRDGGEEIDAQIPCRRR